MTNSNICETDRSILIIPFFFFQQCFEKQEKSHWDKNGQFNLTLSNLNFREKVMLMLITDSHSHVLQLRKITPTSPLCEQEICPQRILSLLLQKITLNEGHLLSNQYIDETVRKLLIDKDFAVILSDHFPLLIQLFFFSSLRS